MSLIAMFLGILLVCGCSEPSPEQEASRAAEGYYAQLVAGDYEAFLGGKAGADSLPDDYREQLIAGYKQFVAQQQRDHHGIRQVQVSTTNDANRHGSDTYVFLMLCFGDSTSEEVVVPMVLRDGRWLMK